MHTDLGVSTPCQVSSQYSTLPTTNPFTLINGTLSSAGVRHNLPLPYRSQEATGLLSAQELEALPAGEVSINTGTGG